METLKIFGKGLRTIKEEILRIPSFKELKEKYPFSCRRLMDYYKDAVVREIFREIENVLNHMEKEGGIQERYITDMELNLIKKAFEGVIDGDKN